MTDTEKPIDDARTTRPRAGMVWKDSRELPGLALTVVAVLALVGCLAGAAMGAIAWTIGLGVIAGVAGVAGIGWVLAGRRRTAQRGNHRVQR